MKYYMLFVIVFLSSIYAQIGITIVSGINISNLDMPAYEDTDKSLKIGLNLAVEKPLGPIVLGLGYLEGGTKYTLEYTTDVVSWKEDFTYKLNYITIYTYYPYNFTNKMYAFGGVQVGKCINGEVLGDYTIITLEPAEGQPESGSWSNKFKSEDINLEYGLILGINYIISEKIGVRLSYYRGISDILEFIDESSNNWQNRGVGITGYFSL